MTLVKYHNQLPGLFERFFNDDFDGWHKQSLLNKNTTLPSVNIRENKEAFFVEVAAPGLDKSDFNIVTDNDVLTIASEKQSDNNSENDEKISRQEFSYRSFKRSFTLPELVEADSISAKYENGILSILIPKKDEAKLKAVKEIVVE